MSKILSLSLCTSLLVVGGFVASCLPTPAPDLTYDTSPDALIIEADARVYPGAPRLCQECNHIPYLRVWGDGRVIRARGRLVWHGQISQSRIQQMLVMLRDEGFFTQWTPMVPNPSGAWTWIKVNLQERSVAYSWNVPESGLVNRLVNQVDVGELEPYAPERALLVAGSFYSEQDLPEWPARFGFSLADVQGQGMWIDGEVLAFVWQEVSSNRHKFGEQMAAFHENDQVWCVSVQIPGVSAHEPLYRCPLFDYPQPDTPTPYLPPATPWPTATYSSYPPATSQPPGSYPYPPTASP